MRTSFKRRTEPPMGSRCSYVTDLPKNIENLKIRGTEIRFNSRMKSKLLVAELVKATESATCLSQLFES